VTHGGRVISQGEAALLRQRQTHRPPLRFDHRRRTLTQGATGSDAAELKAELATAAQLHSASDTYSAADHRRKEAAGVDNEPADLMGFRLSELELGALENRQDLTDGKGCYVKVDV
jgi:hypothetical protein